MVLGAKGVKTRQLYYSQSKKHALELLREPPKTIANVEHAALVNNPNTSDEL